MSKKLQMAEAIVFLVILSFGGPWILLGIIKVATLVIK
jgi:hypothetical protein